MDKRLILAVAGSGKTSYIINQLNESKRSLVITYTINNLNNLRNGIINKFGFIPSNITLFRYFPFLYSFCIKPFLSYKLKPKGINFETNPNIYIKHITREYYFDKYNRMYSNRIAKFLDGCGVINDVNNRLSKYFDNLFIDEVQDLAGNDFNFLLNIVKANVNILLVGDFYQHTFDTSRDCSVNKNLHKDYNSYKNKFENTGILVDTTKLIKSFRCSPSVCAFITDNLHIVIESHRVDNTEINIITNENIANDIYENAEIVKLFYQEHYKYSCFSRNWGDSKGEDKYNDVCVVMNNNTFKFYKRNKLNELPPQTRNKLYVALSRARNNVYIISEKYFNKFKKII